MVWADFCAFQSLQKVYMLAKQASLEELVRKYPRANAYMKAESYAYSSSNNARAAAGKKALERILNGEDYKQAIADMKKEWCDYCEEHVFDN